MIIGNGDIARILPDRDDVLFFASGVSNSGCTDVNEFDREISLMLAQDPRSHIVYFSSLSIYHRFTPYTRHKQVMENIVKKIFRTYCIIRLGNITWGDNPNTFLNYITAKRNNNEPYEIRDEVKYMVDKDELLHWISLIPDFSTEMNVPGIKMSVREALRTYR